MNKDFNNDQQINPSYDEPKYRKPISLPLLILIPILLIFGTMFIVNSISIFGIIGVVNDYDNYFDVSEMYIKKAIKMVNEGIKIQFYEEDTLLLIPVGPNSKSTCIQVDCANDPFEDFKMAYVGVIYTNTSGSFDYYFTAVDKSGKGLKFVTRRELENRSTLYTELSDYAKILQEYYSNNESYEGLISDIHDQDVAEIADMLNVKYIKIINKGGCE